MCAGDAFGDSRQRPICLAVEDKAILADIDNVRSPVPFPDQPCAWEQGRHLRDRDVSTSCGSGTLRSYFRRRNIRSISCRPPRRREARTAINPICITEGFACSWGEAAKITSLQVPGGGSFQQTALHTLWRRAPIYLDPASCQFFTREVAKRGDLLFNPFIKRSHGRSLRCAGSFINAVAADSILADVADEIHAKLLPYHR